MIEKPGIQNSDSLKKDAKAGKPVHHNPADAHAMKGLMKKKEGASDLSSIFSSQSRQIAASRTDKKDALEKRLEKYQQQQDKDQSGQKEDESPDREEKFDDELAQMVAEHILVPDKDFRDPGGADQVRIKISEKILKDAHILITMDENLKIELISTNKHSIQTLVAASDNLEKQLKRNYKGRINIKIIHMTAKGNTRTIKDE